MPELPIVELILASRFVVIRSDVGASTDSKTMKIIFLTILVCFSTTATFADVIAFQSFESTSPANEWTFTTNFGPYNTHGDPTVPPGEDVWAPIETFTAIGMIPTDGTQFWGAQDIDNGFSGDHFIQFSTFDISGESDVVVSFDYNAHGFSSSSDELAYELIYDNVSQNRVALVNGPATTGWQTVSISIPDTVNDLRLNLIAVQQGGTNEYAGFDNVQLNTAIPEPGSLALVGTTALTLAGYTLTRRQSRPTNTPAT